MTVRRLNSRLICGVRRRFWPVVRVAGQRCGMGDELGIFTVVATLTLTELVRPVSLALADALHLRGVQRTEPIQNTCSVTRPTAPSYA
jgi:hypothetical protein